MGWSISGVSYSRSGPSFRTERTKKERYPRTGRRRYARSGRRSRHPRACARAKPERNFVPAVARRYGATGPARGRLTPDTPLGRIPLAAAVGFNVRVLGEPGDNALALYVKSDAMWVGTKSVRTSDIVATQGDVTRVRLTLEGERAFAVGEGATF